VPLAAAEPRPPASNELSMTQELIANMLGVRREGVTDAAGKLQDAGLIRTAAARITVLDRTGSRPVMRVLSGGQDGVRSPPARGRPVAGHYSRLAAAKPQLILLSSTAST
jgi:hypothetical protein